MACHIIRGVGRKVHHTYAKKDLVRARSRLPYACLALLRKVSNEEDERIRPCQGGPLHHTLVIVVDERRTAPSEDEPMHHARKG